MIRYFTVRMNWLDRGRFPRSFSKLVQASNVRAALGKAIGTSKMFSELKGWREREGEEFSFTVIVGAPVGVDLKQFEFKDQEVEHGD